MDEWEQQFSKTPREEVERQERETRQWKDELEQNRPDESTSGKKRFNRKQQEEAERQEHQKKWEEQWQREEEREWLGLYLKKNIVQGTIFVFTVAGFPL